MHGSLVVSDSLQPHGLGPTRLLCPWDFPGENTGLGLPFPPPRDLPYSGVEPVSPGPPAWQADSLPLCHLGSPYTVNRYTHYHGSRCHKWQQCIKKRLYLVLVFVSFSIPLVQKKFNFSHVYHLILTSLKSRYYYLHFKGEEIKFQWK